jgi:hypothetical protein
VIRNLGSDFCKVSPHVISEENLKRKPLLKRPTGASIKLDKKSKKHVKDDASKKK